MSGHLTRAQLEQLLAEDLRVPAALRVHAGSCDRCTVRRLTLERARARYMELYPASEFARVVIERVNAQAPASPRPRRLRWVIAASIALAALAGAVVWGWWR